MPIFISSVEHHILNQESIRVVIFSVGLNVDLEFILQQAIVAVMWNALNVNHSMVHYA
jgi:hypothetical protein